MVKGNWQRRVEMAEKRKKGKKDDARQRQLRDKLTGLLRNGSSTVPVHAFYGPTTSSASDSDPDDDDEDDDDTSGAAAASSSHALPSSSFCRTAFFGGRGACEAKRCKLLHADGQDGRLPILADLLSPAGVAAATMVKASSDASSSSSSSGSSSSALLPNAIVLNEYERYTGPPPKGGDSRIRGTLKYVTTNGMLCYDFEDDNVITLYEAAKTAAAASGSMLPTTPAHNSPALPRSNSSKQQQHPLVVAPAAAAAAACDPTFLPLRKMSSLSLSSLSLASMPNDVVATILSFSPTSDVGLLACVCKELLEVSLSREVVSTLATRDGWDLGVALLPGDAASASSRLEIFKSWSLRLRVPSLLLSALQSHSTDKSHSQQQQQQQQPSLLPIPLSYRNLLLAASRETSNYLVCDYDKTTGRTRVLTRGERAIPNKKFALFLSCSLTPDNSGGGGGKSAYDYKDSSRYVYSLAAVLAENTPNPLAAVFISPIRLDDVLCGSGLDAAASAADGSLAASSSSSSSKGLSLARSNSALPPSTCDVYRVLRSAYGYTCRSASQPPFLSPAFLSPPPPPGVFLGVRAADGGGSSNNAKSAPQVSKIAAGQIKACGGNGLVAVSVHAYWLDQIQYDMDGDGTFLVKKSYDTVLLKHNPAGIGEFGKWAFVQTLYREIVDRPDLVFRSPLAFPKWSKGFWYDVDEGIAEGLADGHWGNHFLNVATEDDADQLKTFRTIVNSKEESIRAGIDSNLVGVGEPVTTFDPFRDRIIISKYKQPTRVEGGAKVFLYERSSSSSAAAAQSSGTLRGVRVSPPAVTATTTPTTTTTTTEATGGGASTSIPDVTPPQYDPHWSDVYAIKNPPFKLVSRGGGGHLDAALLLSGGKYSSPSYLKWAEESVPRETDGSSRAFGLDYVSDLVFSNDGMVYKPVSCELTTSLEDAVVDGDELRTTETCKQVGYIVFKDGRDAPIHKEYMTVENDKDIKEFENASFAFGDSGALGLIKPLSNSNSSVLGLVGIVTNYWERRHSDSDGNKKEKKGKQGQRQKVSKNVKKEGFVRGMRCSG